jgi:hypothetical protein
VSFDRTQLLFDIPDLHIAGNDATNTLHAMLMLAIKTSESRQLSLEREREFGAFASVGTV